MYKRQTGTTVDGLRTAARNVLSTFKVPTVWLLLDSDDTVPRGTTGKVDTRGLRDMLTTRLEALP